MYCISQHVGLNAYVESKNTYFVRESISEQLTCCLTSLDKVSFYTSKSIIDLLVFVESQLVKPDSSHCKLSENALVEYT